MLDGAMKINQFFKKIRRVNARAPNSDDEKAASKEACNSQSNLREEILLVAIEQGPLRTRDPRSPIEETMNVEEKRYPQLQRTFSHDSLSTLSTATGTPMESCYQRSVMTLWEQGMSTTVESSETDFVQLTRFQQHKEIAESVPIDNATGRSVCKPNDKLMNNQTSETSTLSADILLAKKIFSTLGMPKQYPHKLNHRFDISAHTRRSMLRRTSSGGLDPYLRAPERFTRFEI